MLFYYTWKIGSIIGPFELSDTSQVTTSRITYMRFENCAVLLKVYPSSSTVAIVVVTVISEISVISLLKRVDRNFLNVFLKFFNQFFLKSFVLLPLLKNKTKSNNFVLTTALN